jgi:hypothetical protein
MKNQKYIFSIIVLATVGSFALAVPALANNNQGYSTNNQQAKAIVGTVSAVSGNTITVSVKQEIVGITTAVFFTVNATNAAVIKNGVASTLSNIAVGDKVTVQGTVTGTNVVAKTIRDDQNNQIQNDFNKMSPIVVGKVSAINGNILTIISQQGFNRAAHNTTATITVDATNAKLLRGNTTITLSSIAVDDNIVVQGILTGTNVVATIIRDGKVGNGNEGDNNQALLQIQGNGQPVVGGTVSTINGSTLTITNSSNVTYTVDTTNAKIVQGKNTISLSSMKIGDLVIVQGTVNGTTITASTIIDQANSANALVTNKEGKQNGFGFFGSIGQFFRHLFGF